MAVIATVGKVQGEVFAVDAKGTRRRLREGDQIQEGETIITGAGSTVELAFVSGRTITVPEQQTFVADASVGGQDLPDTRSAGVIPPKVVTTDPNQLIQDEATAAGLTGGGSDGGSSFVQLLRIAELGGPPNVYAFGPNVFARGPDTPSGAVDDNLIPTTATVVAANDANSVNEGGANVSTPVAGVLTNDIGTPITVTAVRTGTEAAGAGTPGTIGTPLVGTHGTLTLNADGSYTYVLNSQSPLVQLLAPGETLTDVFTYTMGDGSASDRAELVITINGTEDLPVAVADVNAITEDGPSATVSGSVRTNDTPGDGTLEQNVFTLNGSATGSFGTLAFNPDGSYVYTLANASQAVQSLGAGATVTDTFSYTLTDSDGDTSSANLVITVTGVNDAPVAVNDTLAGTEDTTLTITSANLFGADGIGAVNDTDVDGPAFASVTITGLPATGTLRLGETAVTVGQVISAADIASGQLTFVPAANANGTTTFTYTVSDGSLSSNQATVTLDIAPVNDPPVAANDTFSGTEDTPVVITSAGLFGADGTGATNDFDIDSGTFASITIVSLPGGEAPLGSLRLNGAAVTAGQVVSAADIAAGNLTFVPTANASGSTNFTYTVSDGSASSNVATVTIDIAPVNDPPVAVNDILGGGREDTPLTITNVSLFGPDGVGAINDSDVDSASFTSITITGLPASGTLRLGETAVTVGQVISAADLADGRLTFTPVANFNGTTTFTYTVSDGTLSSNEATVTLNIAPVNDPPVAVDDTFDGADDTALVISSAGLFGADGTGSTDDFDIDSGTFASITIVSLPGGGESPLGTLRLNGEAVFAGQVIQASDIEAGNLTFVPTGRGAGSTSFTYTVSDGELSSNVATVTLNIAATPDAPVAVDDTVDGTEDIPLTISSSSLFGEDGIGPVNDRDSDGPSFTSITVTGLPGGGESPLGQLRLGDAAVTQGQVISTTDIADGRLTFVPTANASGTTTFTYTVSDGSLSSNQATVTINIAPVNDPPVAENDTFNGTEDDASVVITATGLFGEDGTGSTDDRDIDSSTFASITIVSLPGGGDSPLGVLRLSGAAVSAGQVILASDITAGNLTFVPAPDANGSTSFVYTVSDGSLSSNEATVTINIAAVNDAPRAQSDTNWVQVAEKGEASTTGDVIAGGTHPGAPAGSFADRLDSDPDGNSLTVTDPKTYNGTYGDLVLRQDGTYTYTLTRPPTDVSLDDTDQVSNPDTFSYDINDGVGGTASSTLTIAVFGRNDAPVPVNDTNFVEFQFPSESSGGLDVVGTAQGNVLETRPHPDGGTRFGDNLDSDPDANDTLQVVAADKTGTFGTLHLFADGTYTYDYRGGGGGSGGSDTFSYDVTDGTATSTGQLTIFIDNRPVANNDSNFVGEGAFIENDGDLEPDFDFTSTASGNVLGPTTEHPNFFDRGLRDQADTDADGDALTVTAIRTKDEGATDGTAGTVGTALQGAYGTLTLGATGNYTYQYNSTDPVPEGGATDFFTYTISDGALTDVGTLAIRIIQQGTS